MNVMPLEWHRDCLRNRVANLARLEAEAAAMRQRLNQDRFEVHQYGQQVNTAWRRGMVAFDADRFLKPRTVKTNG